MSLQQILNGYKRRSYLDKLKQRGVVTRATRYDDAWVPFQDGVFSCQRVGLDNELQPLLSYAKLDIPKREENYLLFRRNNAWRYFREESANGYAGLECGDNVIAYRPSEQTINAEHLLRSGGISRTMLTKFFQENPRIAKQIRHCHASTQGTYVSFDDASIFRTDFRLDSSLIKDLIQLASVAGVF